MAQAQVNTIRLRLLKSGARIRFTARRVVISMASGYPWQGLFAHALAENTGLLNHRAQIAFQLRPYLEATRARRSQTSPSEPPAA
jgi:hypothetical protein